MVPAGHALVSFEQVVAAAQEPEAHVWLKSQSEVVVQASVEGPPSRVGPVPESGWPGDPESGRPPGPPSRVPGIPESGEEGLPASE